MKLRKKTKKVLTAPKSFTIHRKDWLMDTTRAARRRVTRMLSPEGGMCCLGFFSYACGMGSEDLLGLWTPEDVARRTGKEYIPKLYHQNSSTNLTIEAININDDLMSLKEREEKLTKLFKKHGVEVKFVGKYPEKVVQRDKYVFPEDYK